MKRGSMPRAGNKREAAALKAFAKFGVVKLIIEENGLLLLERAVSGIIYWAGFERRKKKPEKIYSNEAILFLGVLANAGAVYQLGRVFDSGDKVDTTSPMGKAFFQIAGVFAELERGMINSRTKAGIEKAKLDGVKFGRTVGSTNKKTADKIEKIKIFLSAGKSYDWITKELAVSKKTIADIKKSLPSLNLQLASEKSEVYA